MLTYKEMQEVIDLIRARALTVTVVTHASSTSFLIAPAIVWRLRRARLYATNPLPPRKMRACWLRKRQQRINEGARRLARRQRASVYAAHKETHS
jgi:hypothetical protein